MITYTVQPGNTLWGIAQFFGTTVDAIARLNGIANVDMIFPGQRLRIPMEEMPVPQFYTVRPGDTIWEIAQRYGIPVETILSLNNISNPNIIYPGQMIRLRP